jgi:hypothetical protein
MTRARKQAHTRSATIRSIARGLDNATAAGPLRSAVCVGVIDTSGVSPYLSGHVARTALAASQRVH